MAINTLLRIADQPTSATYCNAKKNIDNKDTAKKKIDATKILDQGL